MFFTNQHNIETLEKANGDNDYDDHQMLYDNSLEYNKNTDFNNNESKKNIATQVDYVSLIMARNIDDWNKISEQEDQNRLINLKHEQADDSNVNFKKAASLKNEKSFNRKRLISAPSSDHYDVGDVNLVC